MKDLLLALGAKPGSEEKKPSMAVEIDPMEGDSEPDMDDAGYQAVAGDVMSAFKSGDSAALSEALKAFVEMCK